MKNNRARSYSHHNSVDHACYYTRAAVQLFDGRGADLYQGHIIGLEEFDRIVSSFIATEVDLTKVNEIEESIRFYQNHLKSLVQGVNNWYDDFEQQHDRPFVKLRTEVGHRLLYLTLDFDRLVVMALVAKKAKALSQKQVIQIIGPIKKQIRAYMYQYCSCY